MRKLKNFKTIQLEEGYEVKDLSFDRSGSYLAVAGTDVRVFQCKQWNELLVMHDHTATATGVRFGDNARYAIIVFGTSESFPVISRISNLSNFCFLMTIHLVFIKHKI